MSHTDYLHFKGISNIGNTLLMSELENNLKLYFDWAMLSIGGWNEVSIPTSGAYGGDFSTLRLVRDNSYTDGQVWEGARKDWVWETGVNYNTQVTGSLSGITWDGSSHSITLNTPNAVAESGDVFRVTDSNWTGLNGDYHITTGVTTTLFNTTSISPASGDESGTYTYLANPDNVSVTVNGAAAGAYHINYPLGRVVLDTAVSTTSTVQASYSYRYVQIYRADDAQWWRELQMNSYRPEDIHFTQTGNYGDWSIGGHHRIQLPAIILETVSRATAEGYELGNGALRVNQDVLFHVVAENRFDRNQLVDICRLQHDKTIWLYNTDNVAEVTGFPLDYRGMRVGNNMYPDLVKPAASGGFRWKTCHFGNVNISEVQTLHPRLYSGVVRATMEVIFGNI